TRLSEASGFVRTIRSGQTMYRTVGELDGIDRIPAIEHIGRYPVYVSYGLSIAGMTRLWRDDVIVFAIFAGGAAIALFAVTLLALRRTLEQRRLIAQWQDEVHRRETAEEALRQTQKMEALGQL